MSLLERMITKETDYLETLYALVDENHSANPHTDRFLRKIAEAVASMKVVTEEFQEWQKTEAEPPNRG